MEIQKNDGTWHTIKPNDYKHEMAIEYELAEGTGRKFVSFDRGRNSDFYKTTLVFRKDIATIEELFIIFADLRNNNKPIILQMFEENIFGDHIRHDSIATNPITCILDTDGMGIQESPVFNVMQFEVTLIAVEYIIELGTPALPSLECLQVNWKGYQQFSTTTQMSYGGSFFSTDTKADHAEFEGTYILNIQDNGDLHRFWVWQRGRQFNTTSAEWGTTKMFGTNLGENHAVVIKTIDFEKISPILRQVTITLLRQGDELNV